MCEIVIKNGRLIDGAGNPWHKADIAIEEGRIAKIGSIVAKGARIIDASGLTVSPGFIDAHSHSDGVVLFNPQMESTLAQGITTVVAGNCGWSPAPINPDMKAEMEEWYAGFMPPGIAFKITWTTFDEYLQRVENMRIGANIAHLVGHCAVRVAAIGFDARMPTRTELKTMRKLVEEAMEAGAYGISTGLIYPPGMYAKTSEILELARVAATYGGVYSSHIRGEGRTLLKAVREAISIGEKGGLPTHISHHKASGKAVWGKSRTTLKMMERARDRGVDVTFDQYPYSAGATTLTTLLPPWVHDGGKDRLLERLRDPEQRERMKEEVLSGLRDWDSTGRGFGWTNIVISSVKSEKNRVYEGKNMKEIKEMRGDPDEFTTLWKLLLEERGEADMIIFSMHEDDIRRIMKHPLGMVGTDSSSISSTGPFAYGKPHPRHFGTYPRILGRYVREAKVLSLQEAVRKMTSFPAQTFGMLDRGLLRPGMRADITIFDPDMVFDNATYQQPHVVPTGIPYVIVNGVVAVENSKLTDALAGKALRKGQKN